MVHGREKDQEVPCFIWIQDSSHFVCIVEKINNMRLCVKIMLICDCVMY